MSRFFVVNYILISLLAITLISGTLSYTYVRSIFDAHSSPDAGFMDEMLLDVATLDIRSLINYRSEQHNKDAFKSQNSLLKEVIDKKGSYKYFVYNNYTGQLETELLLRASEELWLGTYNILISDDLISGVYLITNDYKIVGLAEKQLSVPAHINILDKDFKQSGFWQRFYGCNNSVCSSNPYVTNQYWDPLSGDDIITLMLPYRLSQDQFGVIGIDVRTKILFKGFFDFDDIVGPTQVKISDINARCSSYRICLSETVNLFDSRDFHLLWEYDYLTFARLIISTNRFIYLSQALLILKIFLYFLIKSVFTNQARDTLTQAHSRQVILGGKIDRQYAYVLMMDIDNFKSINDSYGHDVGDKVLVAFANHLKNHVRNDDIICRWGGEEFVVLYRAGIDEKSIQEIVRRLLTSPVVIPDLQLNVTFSGGLVKMQRDVSSSICAADKLLYDVKRNGKNNIMLEVNEQPLLLL